MVFEHVSPPLSHVKLGTLRYNYGHVFIQYVEGWRVVVSASDFQPEGW